MEMRLPRSVGVFFQYALLAILIFLLLSVAMPKADGAVRALEGQGFSNVVVSDAKPALWYCSEGDIVYFDVISATNPAGFPLENPTYVCAGFLKGYTIRSY